VTSVARAPRQVGSSCSPSTVAVPPGVATTDEPPINTSDGTQLAVSRQLPTKETPLAQTHRSPWEVSTSIVGIAPK
jgi:hypothetical protein